MLQNRKLIFHKFVINEGPFIPYKNMLKVPKSSSDSQVVWDSLYHKINMVANTPFNACTCVERGKIWNASHIYSKHTTKFDFFICNFSLTKSTLPSDVVLLAASCAVVAIAVPVYWFIDDISTAYPLTQLTY